MVTSLAVGLAMGSAGAAVAAVAPSAPQAPAVSAAVDGSFTVQWSAPASSGDTPIQTYAVQSASTVAGAAQGSCTTAVDTPTCTVSGLDNGIPYTFAVTAFNGVDSPAAVTAAISSQGKPTRPRSVGVIPGNGYADVSWSVPLSNGGSSVTQYNVSTAPSSAGCSTSGGPDLSCRLDNLTIGQQYTVTVTATNVHGTSVPSEDKTVTPRRQSSAPLNVVASPGVGQAAVTWDPPADLGGTEVVSYQVVSSPASSSCVVGPLVRSCTLTGMTNGTSYSVTVYATNAAGQSPASVAATVTPRTTPDPATGVSTVAGDATATVEWQAPDFDGGTALVGYRVETSPASQGCQTMIPNPNLCTLTGLANGTQYQVVVYAVNSVGDSVASSPGTVTPRTNPSAPINLTAVPGNRTAQVSWSAPGFDGGRGLTAYQVTASPGGATCTVSAPATGCELTGLTNGVEYTLTVTATNSAGLQSPGSVSSIVSPLTVPSAPLAVTVIRGVNSAVANWIAPTSDGGRPINSYTVVASPGGSSCVSISTSCTVGGLAPDVDYSFTVVATNAAGTGPTSIGAVQQALDVPGVPRNLKAVPVGTSASKLGKVDVSWKPPANDGGSPVTGYYVRSGTAVCYTKRTSCRLKGLVSSPARVTVEAVNGQGSGTRATVSSTVALTTVRSSYLNWRTQHFQGAGFQPNAKVKVLGQRADGKYTVVRTFRYGSSGKWFVNVTVPAGKSAWKIRVSGYTSPRIVVSR